jgi:hypothetical protein
MHDILIVLRNCAIHENGVGRRDLRPGTIVNVTPDVAKILVSKGYARHVVEPAPLFVDSTRLIQTPKKKARRADGSSNELADDLDKPQSVSRRDDDDRRRADGEPDRPSE